MHDDPKYIGVEFLSGATFGNGTGVAGEVDIETDHDELGLPRISGKTLRGLIKDSYLSLRKQFPELEESAVRIFGNPGETSDSGILHVSDALAEEATRSWIGHALATNLANLTTRDILLATTTIRRQTAESRKTGAYDEGSLRSSRIALRGFCLSAPLFWLQQPTSVDLRCLAMALLGARHAGVSRNRGRGHLRLTIDGNTDLTMRLAEVQ
jgi:hypothetical protein